MTVRAPVRHLALRDRMQELRELGIRDALFRMGWELRTRVGLSGGADSRSREADAKRRVLGASAWEARLPFSDPCEVAAVMRPLIRPRDLTGLREQAMQALHGRVRCFGRWEASFGVPIAWHQDPVTGYRRDPALPWSRALVETDGSSDLKFVWEVGRFPHAYAMARAAAFFPDEVPCLATAIHGQMRSFVQANPPQKGIHWASGQEIVFRLLAWLFALDALVVRHSSAADATAMVGLALAEAADHVRTNIDYARRAVYNNHLLSEALGLYVAGMLLGESPEIRQLKECGRELLTEGAQRQFYGDGAYIQLSHNYHRVALQDMNWAVVFARAGNDAVPAEWTVAIERSIDFLVAHQNPEDGALPNYGSNDGALPGVFSTCDFSDFRPTLQAASLATRGERLYEPGPWDEEAAWLLGPKALEAKQATPRRHSISFSRTGFHVLRSEKDEGTFATFRCGTIRDRFSQIDMLHVDLFWKGQNVLVDGGSYLYNGPKKWHDYFMETGSHNTLTVDGLDQMKHFRKFKCLYWTEAKLLAFRRVGEVSYAAGEHYGYRRHPGACIHRRSIALHDDGTGVVVDTVQGEGRHRVRLHWLLGEFPHEFDAAAGAVALSTPGGRFSLMVVGEGAVPVELTVARGEETPPRGWSSRYFGEKVAVPSLAAVSEGELPVRFISAFGPGDVNVKRDGSALEVRTGSGSLGLRLGDDGLLTPA